MHYYRLADSQAGANTPQPRGGGGVGGGGEEVLFTGCALGSQSNVSKDTHYVRSEGLRLGSSIYLKCLAGLSPPAHREDQLQETVR